MVSNSAETKPAQIWAGFFFDYWSFTNFSVMGFVSILFTSISGKIKGLSIQHAHLNQM